MNGLATQDALELEVAHFGPIVEAKIDLRPLTVFVGPSNTGKSYLAILTYALHRFFSGFQEHRMFWEYAPRNLSQKTIDVLVEWMGQMFVDKENSSVEQGFVLPPPVTNEIRSVLNAQGDQLSREISRCFGMDETSALVRKGNRNGARVVFRRHVSDNSAPFEHELIVGTQEAKFKTTIPEETPIRVQVEKASRRTNYLHRKTVELISRASQRNKEEGHLFAYELMETLIDSARPQLAGPLHVPAFYLPADRTGVMHSHQAVVSALVQNATTAGLRPTTDIPMLSGVLADFLQQLIALDRPLPPYRRRVSRRDLGTQIEEAILRGVVRVDRSEMVNYPHFTYQPKGWKTPLPLMNASSMVSELAPVVLYLRHVVQPGNVLIIEEPEAHLHPAMQVEFTRQIAALVHAGVRVIVTTHSEWVLEELGNIVRRSELPATQQGEFALGSDQVGAWLFKQKRRPRGSVVEEIKLDEETGLYPTDYDDVSLALYNDSVSIFNRIQDSRAE